MGDAARVPPAHGRIDALWPLRAALIDPFKSLSIVLLGLHPYLRTSAQLICTFL
ncbi:MAG: hypothetical protein ACI8W3_003843 [Myxococcota bacterium]|jgi:hypothetical protein